VKVLEQVAGDFNPRTSLRYALLLLLLMLLPLLLMLLLLLLLQATGTAAL
jgi:hypothetical protein